MESKQRGQYERQHRIPQKTFIYNKKNEKMRMIKIRTRDVESSAKTNPRTRKRDHERGDFWKHDDQGLWRW